MNDRSGLRLTVNREQSFWLSFCVKSPESVMVQHVVLEQQQLLPHKTCIAFVYIPSKSLGLHS